jgi:hypothetical protein
MTGCRDRLARRHLVRGRRVMWEGEILGAPAGEPVRFLETLVPTVEHERRG